MNKKYISDPKCGGDIQDYEIDGIDFDKFIKIITDIRKKFLDHKMKISISSHHDETYLYYYDERLETDKEFEFRKEKNKRDKFAAVEREKKRREEKIEKEKIEYERLKKIYGQC